MPKKSQLKLGGRPLNVTNLEKILYPETGFTKGDLINYYIRVSPVLLPHLGDRPITAKGYPDGVDRPGVACEVPLRLRAPSTPS